MHVAPWDASRLPAMRERFRAGLSTRATDRPRLSCIILDTAPHAAQGLATILKARLDVANRHQCSSIAMSQTAPDHDPQRACCMPHAFYMQSNQSDSPHYMSIDPWYKWENSAIFSHFWRNLLACI